ncbi:unnamed protein product [Cylicocyclus nassatus]|uniref:Uncharacterized protein n=1 Tax=Cylicocyclus nassatus TaxID=53992 RepID=A0AA36GU82_CYLNA|nr:unnamed protein product [Cylicocyclus nassatus]
MSCDWLLISGGYCALAYVLYKVVMAVYNILWPYIIAPPIDLHAAAGANWAVVTGATDGIGKAYAFELAKKGFNIYLVSRTQAKLDDVQKEIREKYDKVDVRTFAFDFCNGSLEAYKPLLKALNEVDIGVLINNVGMSYEYPERLHKVEGGIERLGQITTINTLPPTMLTASLLEQMLSRKKGVVVNVSSAASYNYMPLWAVYSATKKYVSWFTEILRLEYAGSGIIFQTISPMMVATKMSKVRRTSYFTPSAEKFAAAAVRSIGLVSETTGYMSHQIQQELCNFVPKPIFKVMILKFSENTRAAALRKRAKSQ